MKFKIAIILGWIAYTVQAQQYVFADSIPVLMNGRQLQNPFTGGLNNAQLNNGNLNDDDLKDLVVFDKGSQKVLPFLVFSDFQGIYYKYAPEFELLFPKVQDFVLMRDYDGDGYEDLFTTSTTGLKVYKYVKLPQYFRFELVADPLWSSYQTRPSTIMVNPDDYPLVQDMDADGDLDVVCFDFFSGARLEYHQNISIEKYGHKDSLIFQQTDDCYGGFQEVGCDTFTFHLNCRLLRKSSPNARVQHVGNGSILSWDMDSDAKNDLLVSKADCKWINFLKNISVSQTPSFATQLRRFAEPDTFRLSGFPVPFAVDVDADGQQEIVISPQNVNSNYILDFETSTYLLNRDLSVKTSAFLQDQTIDLGEHTSVATYDYDADGDKDLLVGYHSYTINGIFNGGIAIYDNIRSDQKPLYSFKTKDYLGLSQKQWVNIIPQFFDINRDGKDDLLITASLPLEILSTKTFVLYGNTEGRFEFSGNIDTLSLPLNIMDAPRFTHFDNESKVFVGKNNGDLLLYRYQDGNWLLQSKVLDSNSDLGFRQTSVSEANVNGDEMVDLVMSNSSQYLLYIKNYQKQVIGAWTIDTIKYYQEDTRSNYPIRLAKRSLIYSEFTSAQKSDIWLGTTAGGLFYLKSSKEVVSQPDELEVFPNPVINELIVRSLKSDAYKIYDIQGKLVSTGYLSVGYSIVSFKGLPQGVYIFKLSDRAKLIHKK